MQLERLVFCPTHRKRSVNGSWNDYAQVSTSQSTALFLHAPCLMSALCPAGNEPSTALFPPAGLHPQSPRVRAATHGWEQLLVPLAARERSRDTHSPKSWVIFHFTLQQGQLFLLPWRRHLLGAGRHLYHPSRYASCCPEKMKKVKAQRKCSFLGQLSPVLFQ